MKNEQFGLSVDRAIGITIEQYTFFTGERRADIGRLLGVTGQSVSSRLHGRAQWTAEDLMAVAAHFGVSVDDLLSVVGVDGSWTPTPLRTKAAPASARAGWSHLRESNSRPIHYE
jgi:betR domain